MEDRTLSICADLFGCPNCCKHCWLGHMPNRRMEDDADQQIMQYFDPYFSSIAFYSWMREPDFCQNYKERWERDVAISKNAKPQRFELASFYRIVRDKGYIPFLKSVGTEKVQLTFFGLKETQDRYVGRKGAYEEIMQASDLLIENGIIPRWQCFINKENAQEILTIFDMYQEIKRTRCPKMEFFVHVGSCDGENRKLYPIRMNKADIPQKLIPYYYAYKEVLTEGECCRLLQEDNSHPDFAPDEESLVLYVSNTYDVYFNVANTTKPWVIGNMKEIDSAEMMRRIDKQDTYALNKAKEVTWAELVERYGDSQSGKAFFLDDYKMYLFNNYLAE